MANEPKELTAAEPVEPVEPAAATEMPEGAEASAAASDVAEESAPPPVAPKRAAKRRRGPGEQYRGLGRRKTSVARVYLRPGEGQLDGERPHAGGLLPAPGPPPVDRAAAHR